MKHIVNLRQHVVTFLQQEKIANRVFFGFLFIMAFFIIFSIWRWPSLPPQLPLFYSLPKSPDQLGTSLQLMLLPFFSFAVFGINLLIASYIYPGEKLAALLLVCTAFTADILFLITFIKIVFLIS